MAFIGSDERLKALIKTVIEAALDDERSDYLGYDKQAPDGRNRGKFPQREGPLRLRQ